MLADHLIICDSNIPWRHNRYSKHHLMSRLARANEVVFANPQVNALRHGLRRRWEQPAGEHLWVFTPLAIPRRGDLGLLRRLDQAFLCQQLRSMVRRHGGKPLVLFMGNPYNVFLLDAFPERHCAVYHCSDDFPELFSGGLRRTIEERERRLIREADLVVCSHPGLLRKCHDLGGNAHLMDHAVDERFIGCREAGLPAPEELRELKRPVIGFTGSLDKGLNYELLRQLARACPDWSFVLVGPVGAEVAEAVGAVDAMRNCHVLGPRPWEQMPAYLSHFDAAIVPFRMTAFNLARSPLKLFEYLAAGLPVVAVPLEIGEPLRPWVRLAKTAELFAEQLAQALAEGLETRALQVQTIRDGYTWDRRAEELSELVVRSQAPACRALMTDLA